MKKQFKDALHRYKVEAFKISHHGTEVENLAKEILDHTGQALQNAYHYHFHEDPSANRVETFNMIKRFTLEALMPPVLEKVMRRIVVLEKQHSQLVKLLDELLEIMSEDDGHQAQPAKQRPGR
jgi:hypothetical protein